MISAFSNTELSARGTADKWAIPLEWPVTRNLKSCGGGVMGFRNLSDCTSGRVMEAKWTSEASASWKILRFSVGRLELTAIVSPSFENAVFEGMWKAEESSS